MKVFEAIVEGLKELDRKWHDQNPPMVVEFDLFGGCEIIEPYGH